MPKNIARNRLTEFGFMIVGVFLLAAAINMFFDANKLVVGGFTGLSIIINSYLNSLFNIDMTLSIINLFLNIPLFIVYYIIIGKGTLVRTVIATILLSVALEITKILPVFVGDMLLVAVYGGVMSGVGIGLVFRGLATTGGVDTVATIIHKLKPHIPVSVIMFICDALIIIIGFFVFGAQKAMYAIISIFISSKCIDTILEGMAFAKAAFIISDKSDEIAVKIMEQVSRGVTSLHGKGMYTGEEKNVILCVFAQKEIAKIKEIVHDIDKKAFIMLTDVKEVLGEGFQPFK